MTNRAFERIAALCAVAVAGLSLLYAVGYLLIAPAAQRKSDVDAFYRSYLASPGGMRIASTCLLLSGLVIGLPAVALKRRLSAVAGNASSWAAITGVAAGFATAAHGLSALVGTDRLAGRFASGDPATHAAVVLAHLAPSPVDPAGLATFCVAGLSVLVFGDALRRTGPVRSADPGRGAGGPRWGRGLGTLGVVLGLDMVALFVANSIGAQPLVLVTGGLASVILGPIWWVGVGGLLWREPAPAS